MKSLRALFSLSIGAILRLTRQRVVVRSLTISTILTIGTIVLTLMVAAWYGGSGVVVVTPELASSTQLEQALLDEGWTIRVDSAPGDAIAQGAAGPVRMGKHSGFSSSTHSLRFEELIRHEIGAGWRPHSPSSSRP